MNKLKLIWLDDLRDPTDPIWSNWIARNVGNPANYTIRWVKTHADFVDIITILHPRMPHVICFDHDLDEEHYTCPNPDDLDYAMFEVESGYQCAEFLVDHCNKHGLKLPRTYIQSSNPVGAKNIKDLIDLHRKLTNS